MWLIVNFDWPLELEVPGVRQPLDPAAKQA
jgi:hypothetical protein